jgi:hypothetical protein
MMNIQFTKATKEAAKLRLSIVGPSGSGKTYSALSIATALVPGGKIALIDTEHGSASKYADIFDFFVAEMTPPFHPDKYVEAIKQASAAGCDVLIFDSLSHAWNGTGGLLDIVEDISKRMKNPNSFAAWKDATPIQTRLFDAILGAPIHIIATMRSKTEYVLQDNGRGQQVPRKIGMAPIQRENSEYEFDVVLDMDIENNAIVTKTRCPALTGKVFAKPGKDIAGILAAWLSGAPKPDGIIDSVHKNNVSAPTHPEQDMGMAPNGNGRKVEHASQSQLNRLHAVGTQLYGADWDDKRHALAETVSKGATKSSKELTPGEVEKLIAGMEKKLAESSTSEEGTPTFHDANGNPFEESGK